MKNIKISAVKPREMDDHILLEMLKKTQLMEISSTCSISEDIKSSIEIIYK